MNVPSHREDRRENVEQAPSGAMLGSQLCDGRHAARRLDPTADRKSARRLLHNSSNGPAPPI
jgi:hypothetical protein